MKVFLVDCCTFTLELVNPRQSLIHTHDNTQPGKRNDVVCVRTYLISFFFGFDKVEFPCSRDFLSALAVPVITLFCLRHANFLKERFH